MTETKAKRRWIAVAFLIAVGILTWGVWRYGYRHALDQLAQRAEVDLALRGAGDILGTAQAGLPKFRIADLERDMELMKMARDDARLILERDPRLESERGMALRNLLYLMGADDYIGLLNVG